MEIRISVELNKIINYAREEAMRTGNYGISPDHLLLAIIRHRSNLAADVLVNLGVDLDDLKRYIDERLFTRSEVPYVDLEKVTFSRGAHNVLSLTVLEATKQASEVAYPEHLLLAICHFTGSCYGQVWLRDLGLDYENILSYMQKLGILSEENANREKRQEGAAPGNRAAEEEDFDEQNKAPARPSPLEEFGYDLTKAAMEGKLDPVVGRTDEINRVLQILGRRKKNNPMLVGDPGVGKSAIVEGIALRIASGDIPPTLAGKRLISLDIASVVAGTKYRGEFEKRIKSIIKEISGDSDIILFIDEFHTIVGAGGASGSLDAANILKPALARGEIRCVGATTMDEFTKIVEKDGALDRRFQKIVVEPTSVAETLVILKNLCSHYERHHNVKYTGQALQACVNLSERYITDRKLPDKAIDAMDEAGSMVRLLCGKDKLRSDFVFPDDIATVIAKATGIPVNKISESENERLRNMKDRLKGRIIGQDEAIDAVVSSIRRNRVGIKDPNRPVGSFMFFGPTGVGKTQLAKSLAELLFDSEENMVRIDMSEYMEKFTVSRLIGAPPGYVGFEEGGQLSEKVRRKPYCVVLLDEIEKAHPDIYNILLQVLDEGRLTDSNGRMVSFKNTILIMTSNVGSREASEFGNGLGFSTSANQKTDNRKSLIEKAVRKTFPPEFLNRVDDLIFFNPLGKGDIEKIVDMELRDLKRRVETAGFKLMVSAPVKKFIAEVGFNPDYGARQLKRAIQRHIEDPVAEFIIEANSSYRDMKNATLRVSMSKDKTSTVVSLKSATGLGCEDGGDFEVHVFGEVAKN